MKRPWKVVFADAWHMYRELWRECLPAQDTPWITFQHRFLLLSVHTVVVMLLMWWCVLGYCVVTIVRGVLK